MNEVDNKARNISVRLIVVFLLFMVVLGALFYISDEIVIEQEKAFDTKIFAILNFQSMPEWKDVMLFFTFFGSSNFLLPAYLLLSFFYFFKKQDTQRSLNVAAIGLSSAALLFLLKNIFRRQRPEEQMLKNIAGYSYPSGHSFSSFTFCGLLIYIIWRTHISKAAKWILSIVLFLFACVVALSRVYFHVHYPSDIIAGFLLSILWLGICYYILIKRSVFENLNIGGTPKNDPEA